MPHHNQPPPLRVWFLTLLVLALFAAAALVAFAVFDVPLSILASGDGGTWPVTPPSSGRVA